MIASFSDYTRGFRNSSLSQAKRQPTAPKTTPESKTRQLRGLMTAIIQELVNLPELSDSDRRTLSICSAVAFLLAGR